MKKGLNDRQINEEQIDKVSGGMIHHNTSKQAKSSHQEFEVIDQFGDVRYSARDRDDANSWAIDHGYGTNNISTSTLKKLRKDFKE